MGTGWEQGHQPEAAGRGEGRHRLACTTLFPRKSSQQRSPSLPFPREGLKPRARGTAPLGSCTEFFPRLWVSSLFFFFFLKAAAQGWGRGRVVQRGVPEELASWENSEDQALPPLPPRCPAEGTSRASGALRAAAVRDQAAEPARSLAQHPPTPVSITGQSLWLLPSSGDYRGHGETGSRDWPGLAMLLGTPGLGTGLWHC